MASRIRTFITRWRALPHLHDKFDHFFRDFEAIQLKVDRLQEAVGRIENRQLQESSSRSMVQSEFRAFSQFGDDGIIQFLIRHVDIDRKIFVEFGADNYNVESNTRFLLANDNWSGLIIDGSEKAIRDLKISPSYVLYDLRAVSAFITRENINQLLIDNQVSGEIGILSIDVDGNDYWIWEAIDVISPTIVIIEYNYRFGKQAAVTIPYDDSFVRSKAHASKLYFGASLKALCHLSGRKGYAFIGCNQGGANAFFVRRDKKPASLKELTAAEGFVAGKFGEMFEMEGELVRFTPEQEMAFLRELRLPLINVDDTAA